MKTTKIIRKNISKIIATSLVLTGITIGGWIAYNTLSTNQNTKNIDHTGHEHVRGLDYNESNLEEAFSHPTLRDEQTYDSENFRIHYSLKGEDKVEAGDDNNNGIPDFVEDVAKYSEEAKAKQLALGWAHPPTDGNWGGNDLYDIYLLAETEGGGFTDGGAEETIVGDNPFTTDVKEKNSAFSYIAIGPRYEEASLKKSRDYLKILMAHEYQHAIQFGYDTDEPTDWLWEGGASWIEEQLFDSLDSSHEMLDSVFKSPDSCQASYGGETRVEDDGRVYGMWIYLQYLSENYSPDIVRSIWEEARFKDGYEALDAALEPYGTDTNTTFKNFMVALLTRNFEEGNKFPTVRLEATVSSNSFTTTDGVGQLAADFVELDFDGVQNIQLTANQLEGQIVGIRNQEASVFDVAKAGITLDANDFEKLYLIVFNPEHPTDEASCSISNYSISINPTTQTVATATKDIKTVVNFETPEVEGLVQESNGFFGNIVNSVASTFGLPSQNNVQTIHPPATLVPSYLPASLELSEAYTEMYEGSQLTILEYLSEDYDAEDYLSIVSEEAPAATVEDVFDYWEYDLTEVDKTRIERQVVLFEQFIEDGETVQMASFIKGNQFIELSSNLSKAQLRRVVASLL